MRTTEALRRIESSTGVTEKRLEDIISGRVGAISDSIVERLLEDRTVRARSPQTLAREVRESVLEEMSSPILSEADREVRRQVREKHRKARERYRQFHDSLLLELANSPQVTSLKIGDGSFEGDGDDLVDGVFEFKGQRVGVVALAEDLSSSDLSSYLARISKEIAVGTFSSIILGFDGDLCPDDPLDTSLRAFKQLTREDISARIHLFSGELDKIAAKIRTEFGLS